MAINCIELDFSFKHAASNWSITLFEQSRFLISTSAFQAVQFVSGTLTEFLPSKPLQESPFLLK